MELTFKYLKNNMLEGARKVNLNQYDKKQRSIDTYNLSNDVHPMRKPDGILFIVFEPKFLKRICN